MILTTLSWSALWAAAHLADVPMATFVTEPPVDLDDERLDRLAAWQAQRQLAALGDSLAAVVDALGRFRTGHVADPILTADRHVSRATDAEATTVVDVRDGGARCIVSVHPVVEAAAVVLGTAERIPPIHGERRPSACGAASDSLAAVDGRLVLGTGRRLGEVSIRGVFDAPQGGALVRLDTTGFGICHVMSPRVGGRLTADVIAAAVGGLGTVRDVAAHGDGLVLRGEFGVLELPADGRIVAIDRWRGEPGADEDVDRLVAAVLGAPQAQVRIVRSTATERHERVLTARADHGVEQVAGSTATTVFAGSDLVLRTLDHAGLLAHPHSSDAGGATAAAFAQIELHVVRSDGSLLVGGTASWLDVGACGHVVRLPDGPDDGSGATQPVHQLASELLDHFGVSDALR